MTMTDTKNDLQTMSAELAALAADGDSSALAQLWELNRGLLRSMFWKWYPSHREQAEACGLTADDFEQEGYFAVLYAAEHYDPEKGFAFSTWLAYAMKRQIYQTLTGGHLRRITGQDGKTRTTSANPLDCCTSLDVPMDAEDDGAATLGDLQPDPAASAEMQSAEERIYTEELHSALEEALHKLPEREEMAIRSRFYEQKTIQEVAEAAGMEPAQAKYAVKSGLGKLRQNPRLNRWHDEVISSHAWHGTGFAAWKHSGSAPERAVEHWEKCENSAQVR